MIRSRTFFILLAVLIILIAAGCVVYFTQTPPASPVAEEGVETYANSAHGYSLSYPASLEVREYTPDNAVFGTISSDAVAGVAEARVMTVMGTPGQSFETAVATQLANLCAADGPESSFSCTGISRSESLRSNSGLDARIIYLSGELRNLRTGSVSSVEKGPYIVFVLATGATASKALVIHAPLNQSTLEANDAIIRSIARSVTFTPASQSVQSIEDYIRANISTLSPAPEVLGGTFYVTSVEAANGIGTVSYEDGHNAYIADFTYETGTSGSPSIDSFVVRAQ